MSFWRIVRLMPNNFYGYFRHETCGSQDCSKISKFWAKTMLHGHRSGDVDDVQRWSRFGQKGDNWRGIMGVWLGHWNQNPIITMEASRKAKTVVHHEFLPQDCAVSKEYYLVVMSRLREAIMDFALQRTTSHIIVCAWVFGQKRKQHNGLHQEINIVW